MLSVEGDRQLTDRDRQTDSTPASLEAPAAPPSLGMDTPRWGALPPLGVQVHILHASFVPERPLLVGVRVPVGREGHSSDGFVISRSGVRLPASALGFREFRYFGVTQESRHGKTATA